MMFEVDPELVVPDSDLSVFDGAISPWAGGHAKYFHRLLEGTCEQFDIDGTVPWGSLPAKQRKLLLYGVGGDRTWSRCSSSSSCPS